MELLPSDNASAPTEEAFQLSDNLRLSGSESMKIHIDAILLLANVVRALRRELYHCRWCHAEPSRQQLQAETFEETISVCIRRAPREKSFHSLADHPLASV